MKRIVIYLFFLFSNAFNINAQVNLVPNHSFEDTTQCPFNPFQINFAPPWTDPTSGTSDLFNVCNNGGNVGIPNNIAGYQLAKTGSGYAGIGTYGAGFNHREYIQVVLDSQLIINKSYSVEFYVSLADTQRVAANNIGAYFSNTAISGSAGQVLNFIPQVSNNPSTNPLTDYIGWTRVFGNFTAIGGENYLTIGNFLDDVGTDTVLIGGGCSGCNAAYYYIDDISVICTNCTTGINEFQNDFSCNLYPNPNDGNMTFTYTIKDAAKGEFLLYDVTGKLLTKYPLQIGKNNQLFLQKNELNAGVYFYRIFVNNKLETSNKIVIIK